MGRVYPIRYFAKGDYDQAASWFNTGMALQGLLAAYRETGEPTYRDAARRAADFLLHDIGSDGHFRSHGPFVEPNTIKSYTGLCAWALFEALEPKRASELVDLFVAESRKLVPRVETGRFAADMRVFVENDGPVTILIDSKRLF